MTRRAYSLAIIIIFWGSVFAATFYIASIGSLGIYYDYHLIHEYPIISFFNGGGIGLDEFLNKFENYDRKYEVYTFGSGRFHPGYLFDLLFISETFNSTDALWLYEAALFLICIATIFGTTLHLVKNKILAAISVLTLFFHPGFWYIWTTLASTTEAQTMAFLSAGLFFYMQNREKQSIWNSGLCILCVVISFVFKEPVFIAVGVFAGTHLLLNFKTIEPLNRKLNLLLLACAFLYFGLYFAAIIWPLVRDGIGDSGLYFDMKSRGTIIQDSASKFWHHLKIYGRSDPFLVFVMLPLAVLHFGKMISGPISAHDKLVAAFFAGGIIWLAQYLTLGISDIHFKYYAVPAYCFTIPAISAKARSIFFNASDSSLQWLISGQKIILSGLICLSLAIHVVEHPNAKDWILNNRMDFKNWERTIDKAEEIVLSNRPNKTYFYFYKSPRTSTIELYESFSQFMVSRGMLPKDFDLTYASNDNIAWSGHVTGSEVGGPNAPWGWRRNFRARPTQTGDYLIVNSWWPFVSNKEIDEVLRDWELIFQTNGLYDCETFSVYGISRYLLRYADLFLDSAFPAKVKTDEEKRHAMAVNKYGSCSPLTNGRNFYIFKRR